MLGAGERSAGSTRPSLATTSHLGRFVLTTTTFLSSTRLVRLRLLTAAGATAAALMLAMTGSSAAPDSPADYIARIEGPQSPNRQGFDPLTIEQMMARFRIPGVSVAVIRDYEIHWAKGYGLADVESKAPVDERTMFQAASISKPVTAMAVMRAVQDGTLSLDTDVNTLLESWKVPASEHTKTQPVTLRALLSHTSGTGDGFGFPGYHPDAPRPTVVQILNGEKPSNVGKVLFERPPFTYFKYSGGGTTIVQLALIERLKRPFPELLKATVLDPVGLKNSVFEQPLSPERDKQAARAHDGQGRTRDAKWHVYPELAAAGLWTTPSDLARIAIDLQRSVAMDQGKVLSRATARAMLTPAGVGPHAVGWGIEKRGEGWYFAHGGGNWGFSCLLVGHMTKGYGVAIMTNSDSGGAILSQIEQRVAAAYNWDTLDKAVPR
jgi:CubicO group peptidase (beta-lactamase class C family)